MQIEDGFTQTEFAKAYRVGMFAKVKVVSNTWTSFNVHGVMRSGDITVLTVSRGRGWSRNFRNPAVALAILRKMGVKRVEMEMDKWDPTMTSLSMRMRPDVTARRQREKRNLAAAYFPEKQETGPVTRHDELMKYLNRKMREPDGPS